VGGNGKNATKRGKNNKNHPKDNYFLKYELKNNSGNKWEKMQLRGEEKPT
jgi:hypothetical protein